MGCDIHGFIEVKNGANSWIRVRSDVLGGPRNYEYFGALAGVRHNVGEPIQYERGIPSDVSRSGMGGDDLFWPEILNNCHSHGWVTLDDIEAWLHVTEPGDGQKRWSVPYIRELRGLMMGIAEDFSVTDEDVRYVFWFDS